MRSHRIFAITVCLVIAGLLTGGSALASGVDLKSKEERQKAGNKPAEAQKPEENAEAEGQAAATDASAECKQTAVGVNTLEDIFGFPGLFPMIAMQAGTERMARPGEPVAPAPEIAWREVE